MEIPLEKDQLQGWRARLETKEIWRVLSQHYQPYSSLRICDLEKVEYYRCMADMIDDLEEIFNGRPKSRKDR